MRLAAKRALQLRPGLHGCQRFYQRDDAAVFQRLEQAINVLLAVRCRQAYSQPVRAYAILLPVQGAWHVGASMPTILSQE